MQLNTFTYIAIMICTGLLFGRIAKQFKLPNVTGYLVGGLIIGPSVLGIIPEQEHQQGKRLRKSRSRCTRQR